MQEISFKNIGQQSFGGDNSLASAYMLMYRQISKEDGEIPKISDDCIPNYIKEVIKKEDEEQKNNKRFILVNNPKDFTFRKIHLKVYYKGKLRQIQAFKDDLFKDLVKKVASEF